MPIRVEQEGLRQRAGGGHKHRLHLPVVKNVSPAGPELDGGLKLSEEVFAPEIGAIEVRSAIHEYAIFGIELPDRIASPVVVNEDFLGLVAGPLERDSFFGKLLRLGSILVAGKSRPLHQCKHSHQHENSPVKKRPEPRGDWMLLGDCRGR